MLIDLGIPVVGEDKIMGIKQLLLGLRGHPGARRHLGPPVWRQGNAVDRRFHLLGTQFVDATLCQPRWLVAALRTTLDRRLVPGSFLPVLSYDNLCMDTA